ncbi:MAG: alpha-galactosidase [Eubacteriales bacterium]|nr:alpha-galactosidase [Eubacteriales bacterium]
MIRVVENVCVLETPHTTYMFKALSTGQLEHLYYGACLHTLEWTDEQILRDAEALSEKHEFPFGNSISYDEAHPEATLEDMRLEISAYGKGDIREPFIELVHEDGSRTQDFLFEKAEVLDGKPEFKTLPGSYYTSEDEGMGQHLRVTLKDRNYGLTLELNYWVYEDSDVITRSDRLINESETEVRLHRMMSCQIDFTGGEFAAGSRSSKADSGVVFTTFNGAWAREMGRHDTAVTAGKVVNSSVTGSSSSRANPFVMISDPGTSETAGNCLGVNLIYSGNHYESLEASQMGKYRFTGGINPAGFEFIIGPGEDFEAPEAVMAFSDRGFEGVSLSMQRFVREHIVRGLWKHKERPVLLNSWEAAYFKFDERKLLRLARAAKSVGIELFVMDDGWFGERNSDDRSLGDWNVNKKKLPGGLKRLADRIHAMGMAFGIWVEPEMVNVKSDLYRSHSDWTMEIPGKPHSEGRHQRVLDLANPEVADWVIETMSRLFSSADINYVKWDMNRIFSDVYSQYLPADRQGETAHRYMVSLYRIMKTLTERFPKILFEGCAAGGNRFDLGILSYFPQIWASDDTDPIERAEIQEGYSYGYPMSALTAHVSASPNHQTLRKTPLDTRFDVAAFGVLGYELNLTDLTRKELEAVKGQIAQYKKWRSVLQGGDFYRVETGNVHQWTCVAPDKQKAVGLILSELARPNQPYGEFRARGLKLHARYHFYSYEEKRDIRDFGDLVNTASPVHVRPGSALHGAIAKFVEMPGEHEDAYASGAVLMNGGIKLSPAYAGTGYNDKTRYFADFSSRLYFMETEEKIVRKALPDLKIKLMEDGSEADAEDAPAGLKAGEEEE